MTARSTVGRLALRFPHELSSGQSQLFALALTLARPFDLLIVDGPEQRLDPERLAVVAGALRARVDGGAALVVATHSLVLVDAVADAPLELVEPDP